MRVLATSDLHGTLPDIEPCDLLVIAGDICPDHPIGKTERYGLPLNGADYQLDWLAHEFRGWLREVPAKKIIGIAGNHDFVFEKMHVAVAELMLPWTYLLDQTIEYEGLKIHGTPWVPGLPRWAFHANSRALELRAQSIPSGLDILISHGPPMGMLDKTVPMFGSKHVGDVELRAELDRIAPRVLVCGHIHEQFGSYPYSDRTTVFNVSLNDEYYDPKRPIVELPVGKDT